MLLLLARALGYHSKTNGFSKSGFNFPNWQMNFGREVAFLEKDVGRYTP